MKADMDIITRFFVFINGHILRLYVRWSSLHFEVENLSFKVFVVHFNDCKWDEDNFNEILDGIFVFVPMFDVNCNYITVLPINYIIFELSEKKLYKEKNAHQSSSSKIICNVINTNVRID